MKESYIMSTLFGVNADNNTSLLNGAPGTRRSFMRMAAMAGLAAAGASFLTKPVRAAGTSPAVEDSIQEIFTVARTAEQLAVTFYRNGIAKAALTGIHGDDLTYFHAAVIHEQIHQAFFTANGGQSLASTFSFPHGEATFTDQTLFFETQQILEGAFDSAFLAAVKEFAELGQPVLAQIAAQVAMIESEHRVLGRQIGGLGLPDNWVFAPVLVQFVSDAPTVLADAGFPQPRRRQLL